ncbi:DUF3012 domain-containing protein [Shewanella surugensis]|uniref:DUF3012 domain-containing protein n=1 Tax=Shewanella surugensis TaxID=212020 RepID=A0ABT0LG72_9GAMM|nr:DUF3012 domain-containing protein [Shewanella surugensis]MCL1126691.1 DUF3012 domain-containing protein [Shewanella surugensis]
MSLSKRVIIFTALFFTVLLTACTPKVGSEDWCKQMSNKPSGDWTVNETADYAKHCIFD